MPRALPRAAWIQRGPRIVTRKPECHGLRRSHVVRRAELIPNGEPLHICCRGRNASNRDSQLNLNLPVTVTRCRRQASVGQPFKFRDSETLYLMNIVKIQAKPLSNAIVLSFSMGRRRAATDFRREMQ